MRDLCRQNSGPARSCGECGGDAATVYDGRERALTCWDDVKGKVMVGDAASKLLQKPA